MAADAWRSGCPQQRRGRCRCRDRAADSAHPRGRLLRPRQDADAGLVGLPVRPGGAQGGAAQPPPAARRRVRERPLPAARRQRCRTRRRCGTGSRASLEGTRVRDLERLGVRRARRHPAADVPADAAARPRAPGRRPARRTSSPRPPRSWPTSLAQVLAFDGGDRLADLRGRATASTPARPTGAVHLRRGKARAIARAGGREGIDLAASYAYSDSDPTCRCSSVGHPVAVNPDAELARLARRNGWEIVRLDRLRLGLTALGATGFAALAGGVTAAVLVGRRRSA